jgi:hypothetical protein
MVEGLHILMQNRTKKFLAIVLGGAGRELRGRESGSDLTNVQYKPIWNCHNECPLYNEYILIKKEKEKKRKSSWNTVVLIYVLAMAAFILQQR